MAVFGLLVCIELDRFEKVFVINLMCEDEEESRLTSGFPEGIDYCRPTDSRAAGGGTSDISFVHLYLCNCLNPL